MTSPSLADSLHRRAWRLASMLTGSPAAADEVLRRIGFAGSVLPPDDPARLDRLVIMHTREVAKASRRRPRAQHAHPPPTGDAAALCMAAVLSLPHQQREAWVLARLDELDDLRVSRAMDCSRTAAERHLSVADERMTAALGDRLEAAVAELRAAVDAMDPGPAVAAHRRLMHRRARQRAALAIGLVLAVLLGGALAALTLLG